MLSSYFWGNNTILRNVARLKYSYRKKNEVSKPQEVLKTVKEIREKGYSVRSNLFESSDFESLIAKYTDHLENKLNIELPCLGNSLVDPHKHRELIEKSFALPNSELKKLGVTFDHGDFKSYSEILEKFNPSTLKVNIPSEKIFYDFLLNEFICSVVEEYMGFRPFLMEAYFRRNFPSSYEVMNHKWHRDLNNKFFLLKVFFFLSDCDEESGPHEFVEGSHKDFTLNGKTYYKDSEIDDNFSPQRRVLSILKRGSVVFEDTRGLHRANIPRTKQRDLGYAIFLPRRKGMVLQNPLYTIESETFKKLNSIQQSFIPEENIVQP